MSRQQLEVGIHFLQKQPLNFPVSTLGRGRGGEQLVFPVSNMSSPDTRLSNSELGLGRGRLPNFLFLEQRLLVIWKR